MYPHRELKRLTLPTSKSKQQKVDTNTILLTKPSIVLSISQSILPLFCIGNRPLSLMFACNAESSTTIQLNLRHTSQFLEKVAVKQWLYDISVQQPYHSIVVDCQGFKRGSKKTNHQYLPAIILNQTHQQQRMQIQLKTFSLYL